MNTRRTYHANVTTMTRKGQASVPATIRKALGRKEGDKVEFALASEQKQQATLKRMPSVTTMTFGALASNIPMGSPKEERLAAAEDIADEVAAEDRR